MAVTRRCDGRADGDREAEVRGDGGSSTLGRNRRREEVATPHSPPPGDRSNRGRHVLSAVQAEHARDVRRQAQ